MVAVSGNERRRRASGHFRKAELRMAAIASGDDGAAARVEHTMHKAAVPQLKKAGVLMQHRWKDRADHEILDGAVGKGRSVALAVTFSSLAISWFAVLCLA